MRPFARIEGALLHLVSTSLTWSAKSNVVIACNDRRPKVLLLTIALPTLVIHWF